jgi:hypothetical protein
MTAQNVNCPTPTEPIERICPEMSRYIRDGEDWAVRWVPCNPNCAKRIGTDCEAVVRARAAESGAKSLKSQTGRRRNDPFAEWIA